MVRSNRFSSLTLSTLVFVLAGCSTQTAMHASAIPRAAGADTRPLRATANARELNNRAADRLEANDVLGAEQLLIKAIEADPYFAPAVSNLGNVRLANDSLQAAAELFERASKLSPESTAPRINLALTLERAGRYQEALRQLERLPKTEQDRGAAHALARRLTLLLGN